MVPILEILKAVTFSCDSLLLRVTSRLQDEHAQAAALSALEQHPKRTTYWVLVKHLKYNASPYIRGCAALVLGRLKAGDAKQPLIEALSDSSPWVRGLAIFALGHLQDSNALPAFCRALGDNDPWVREQAADALINYQDEVSDLVLGLLQGANVRVCVWALYVLTQRGDLEGTSDILLKMLNNGNRAIQLSAMRALKRLMPDEAARHIRSMIYNPDKYVRAAAAFSVGELEDRESIDLLCRVLDDASAWVRRNAAWSLLEMGEALALVASKLEDEDAGVRRYAIDANRRLQSGETLHKAEQ